MTRKFTVGRQGEQLLNEEWHNLFMSLKYLNYKRYENIHDPKPEKQTDIPDHALRINSHTGVDLIETFYPTLGQEGQWKSLFEGYFHPASALKPETIDPAPYQLCIDPKTGAIKYYHPEYGWLTAKADQFIGDVTVFNGLNYQLIANLEKAVNKLDGTVENYCPVPYVRLGRLFSAGKYVLSEEMGKDIEGWHGYYPINDCAIVPGTEDTDLSWVHVNATKLTNIEKRLIKIKKSEEDKNRADYGFIRISATQTEFYGFISGNRQGTLLIKDKDFKDVLGGIELLESGFEYDYIYCMTYSFDNYPTDEGYILTGRDRVGENNQVFVGQSDCPMALFMDGLALEQTDEIGNEIYLHDEFEGTITFTDDEDANIVMNMQMTALALPKRTDEFLIAYNSNNCIIDEENKTVKITTEYSNNIEGYKHPMVFCSGLGLQETEIFEDVIIKGNEVTIKNFVLPYTLDDKEPEPIKGFIADIGDSYMSKGRLDHGMIYDKNIEPGSNYIIFANGLLMTPTNGDILVDKGQIQIVGASEPDFGDIDYVLFEVDDHNDNKLGIIFDDTVSYHSIRIQDYNDPAVYNDCHSAIVYIDNGIIIDQAAIEQPLNRKEGFYKSGQIIKTLDDYGNGQYYIYEYVDEPRQLTRSEAEEIEYLIGYYSTDGSIHLLGDDDCWNGCFVNYYAYSFANMIDEPMVAERKLDLIIPPTNTKNENTIYAGQTSRMHVWNKNCNALSTYINGLIVENIEIDKDGDNVLRDFTIQYPKFHIPTNHSYYGEDANLIQILKSVYDKYKDIINPKNELKESYFNIDDNYLDDDNLIPISRYFASNQLFIDAVLLSKYIYEDMQKESVSCVIEKIERDEYMSAYRDFIYLEVGKDKDHGQILGTVNDSIEVDWSLVPATAHVYLNGVLLNNSMDYVKFQNNKIMFNVDVCGLQQLPSYERMKIALPSHLSERDKEEVLNLYEKEPKKIIRLIEDQMYYIPTSSRDEILVEKRADISIKSMTYDILYSTYNDQSNIKEFSSDLYDIPESLVNTIEYVKIYINGVRYDGEYKAINEGGKRIIRLLDCDLKMDPIYRWFEEESWRREEYKEMHGEYYKRKIDKITFEWR